MHDALMTRFDRRAFLKLSGAGAGALLVACDGSALDRPVGHDATHAEHDATEVSDTASDPDVPPEETVSDTVVETFDVLDETVDTSVNDTVATEVEPDTSVALDSEDQDIAPDTVAPAVDPPWDTLEAKDVFPFGVQAGDASETGVLLQVHYLGIGPLRVSIRRTDEPDFDRVALAVPNEVGAVRVQGINLAPGGSYRFVFWAPEGRSAIGRFHTALSPGQRRVIRFAGSACTNLGVGPFTSLQRAAEMSLDFYVLAGDTTYCDGAHTLDEYRSRWRGTRETSDYQALFASTGVYATWDDHEVTNDWDPEVVPPERVEAAVTAFEENVPLHARQLDGTRRIWRSQRWGDVLELFVLDCRGERLPSTAYKPNAQYVSRAQLDWLKAGLSASRARWKIIVSSVPITDMPDYFEQVRDRWARYPTQRTELL